MSLVGQDEDMSGAAVLLLLQVDWLFHANSQYQVTMPLNFWLQQGTPPRAPAT